MENLPELVAFSQYKLGGVQNFYYNILSHAPPGMFDIRWIFEEVDDGDPRLSQLYGIGEEIIFPISTGSDQTTYQMASRLAQLVSNRPGIVLANFWHDLVTLHLHRRPQKTIFFVCHDEGYVQIARNFEFLIDVFIAHNLQFFEAMKQAMPAREKDIFFIPFGVKIPELLPKSNDFGPLRLVISARLQEKKGVYDIPLIDTKLKESGVTAQWTIIGRGPEEERLKSMLLPRGNFSFYSPIENCEVLALMQQQDIFILPSRLDGLPVALLEAMSVYCVPVISAFNEGIKRVVTEDIGYVLPIGDIDAFAKVIVHLNNNRLELQERAKRARSSVMREYNIEEQAKKYFELFSRFRELKKPIRKHFYRYGGWLDYPFLPSFLRDAIRKIKKAVSMKFSF
jgi:glycosyltransferase involved in cell wall biosynthesis